MHPTGINSTANVQNERARFIYVLPQKGTQLTETVSQHSTEIAKNAKTAQGNRI